MLVLILAGGIFPQVDEPLNGVIFPGDKKFEFTEFKQLDPDRGLASTENTRVSLRYDAENLYVTFRLEYNNPGKIFGSVLERDQALDADDYVEVIIDSYNDKNNALGFQANYLGTRRDFELSDNGQSINNSWNAFWDVKIEKTGNGWNAEFMIPFSTLRYEAAEKNIMGFKFIRHMKAGNETDLFPLKNSELDGTLFHLYNAQEIEFENLRKKSPLYLTPYVAGNVFSNSVLNSSGNAYVKENSVLEGKNYFKQEALDKILSNVGLDLKYRVDNSTTVDMTLNTDFAQAESDDRIINLSRYSISLSEKRPFFLENREFFSASGFQHQLFYSRKIGIYNGHSVPIIGGVRLTGNKNNFQYGVMNIQTNRVDDLNLEAQNFSVIRLVKYFPENNSSFGGILTNKISTESKAYSRTVGLDARYFFNDEIAGYFFYSKNFDNNSTNARNNSFGLALNKYQRNGYILNYRYRDYQENFNPQTGFLERPNSKRLTINNGYAFTLTNSFLTYIDFGHYHSTFWISGTNQPEYGQDNLYYHSLLKNGGNISAYLPVFERDHLYSDWKFSDNITIPAGKYNFTTYEVYYNSGNANKISFELDPIIGGFYGGFQFIFLSSLSVIVNRNFNAKFGFNYHHFDFPGTYSVTGDSHETITLYSARLNYSFSSFVALKAFLQYDNLSKSFGSNIRFRLNPAEGTDLYIVFNQNINTDRYRHSPSKPLIESQALVIKFSKTLIF